MKRHDTSATLMRWLCSLFNGRFPEMVRQRWFRTRPARKWNAFRHGHAPVDANRVVFSCTTRNITCNPKALARELVRRRPDLDLVWLLDDAAYSACRGKPDTGRAVKLWSGAAYRAFATAKVLVENADQFAAVGYPAKRQGQYILNTWHGSLGIKRLDTSHSAKTGKGRRSAAMMDAVLVNSDFEAAVFASSPLAGVRQVRTGHPRNDIFFLTDVERLAVRRRVFAALGIPEETKVALFAPTFRDEAFAGDTCAYDFAGWQAALEARFGGKWIVALRLHPLDARAVAEGLIKMPQGVANATNYEDIQELLVAVDAGITDYSSWIYDYLLGGKPGFLYAPDKAAYDRDHGFYYPLESTPFPVAESNESLVASIRAFDAEKFSRDATAFLKEKGCMEDGHASARAADLIEHWLAETGVGETALDTRVMENRVT